MNLHMRQSVCVMDLWAPWAVETQHSCCIAWMRRWVRLLWVSIWAQSQVAIIWEEELPDDNLCTHCQHLILTRWKLCHPSEPVSGKVCHSDGSDAVKPLKWLCSRQWYPLIKDFTSSHNIFHNIKILYWFPITLVISISKANAFCINSGWSSLMRLSRWLLLQIQFSTSTLLLLDSNISAGIRM